MSTISALLRSPARATVSDHFYLQGRGSVFVCSIVSGVIRFGDTMTLIQSGVGVKKVKISGIEMDRKLWNEAYATETVGLLICENLSQFGSGAILSAE